MFERMGGMEINTETNLIDQLTEVLRWYDSGLTINTRWIPSRGGGRRHQKTYFISVNKRALTFDEDDEAQLTETFDLRRITVSGTNLSKLIEQVIEEWRLE
jgi:hypothetical protein